MLEIITLVTLGLETALATVLVFRHYAPEASHDEAQ